jgi:3-isopropylmalate dehydrogenase
MAYTITVLPGDGIGVEVTEQAAAVIRDIGKKFGHTFHLREALMGGCAIDKTGSPLPEETLKMCKDSDAVLLGAVGGPEWETLPGNLRPEAGLLKIRAGLGLYANLRPAVIYPALKNASPLRPDIISDGVDILVVRELTGGIYFGERGRKTLPDGTNAAYDTEQYSTAEVERIASVAFGAARKEERSHIGR